MEETLAFLEKEIEAFEKILAELSGEFFKKYDLVHMSTVKIHKYRICLTF